MKNTWKEKEAGNLDAVPNFPSLCYFYRMGRMLQPTAQGPWKLLVRNLLRPGLSNSNPTFTLTCLMTWLLSQSIPGWEYWIIPRQTHQKITQFLESGKVRLEQTRFPFFL